MAGLHLAVRLLDVHAHVLAVLVHRARRPADLLREVLHGLVPSPFSIEGGKIEAEVVLHIVLGGS